MDRHDIDETVLRQLRRLWVLLSEMDAAHLARLAKAAGKSSHRSSGRRAA